MTEKITDIDAQTASVASLPPSGPSTRRIALLLFAFLSCVYLLLSSGRVRTPDEYMTMFEAQSLMHTGSSAVPQALRFGNFYGKLDLDGKPRPPYPPGQALLAVPTTWVGEQVLTRATHASPESDEGLVLAGYGAAGSTAVISAAAMMFFFLIAGQLGANPRDSILVTFCVAFGTLFFPYSGYFFAEPLITLLMLAAIYLFLAAPEQRASSVALAGLLMGYAVWVRPTSVFAIAIFVAAIALRRRDTRFATGFVFSVSAAILVLLIAMRNLKLFGNVADFGYPTMAEAGRELNTFHTPLWLGLGGFLISPGKSILLWSPLIILGIIGLRTLWHLNRGLAFFITATPAFYLLFFSKLTNWEGGYCLGPRYFVPSIVLLCLPITVLIQRSPKIRPVMIALAAFGCLLGSLGSSISFLEAAVASRSYYDRHWNYRFWYDPLVIHSKLLIAYLSGKPSQLGTGFDRWWVFLHHAGVNGGVILALAAVLLLSAAGSGYALRRALVAG